MSTGIAADMLTELRGKARVFPTLDLTLAGTTYRFASEPIASESQGRYEPFVQRWGIIERGIDLHGYALQNPRITVVVYDRDGVIRETTGGPASGAVMDSDADIVLRSYYVPAVSHYTIVDGVVADYPLIGDHLYQYVITPDDRALHADSNNIPTLVNADWFSGLPSSSRGMDGQIVYGEHISSAIEGATGMVNCTMVYDTGTYSYWYVSIGAVDEVIAVWRNSTLATSDFSLSESWTINGATISLIRDTTGTSVETDAITVDVRGVKDNDGVMISNPVDMVKHFFDQFVFGAYPTGSTAGAWLASSGMFNSTHLAETSSFLSNRNHTCAKVITSSERPIDVLNNWCESHKCNPFWSWDWKLGLRILNPAVESTYTDHHIKQVDGKILSPLTMRPDRNRVISQIVGDYLYKESSSSFAFQKRIADPDRTLISVPDSFAYGESKAI